jgi:hypothetical protein
MHVIMALKVVERLSCSVCVRHTVSQSGNYERGLKMTVS